MSLIPQASQGHRAVQVTAGYDVLQQNLQRDDLAGKTLRIKLDAASPDGATVGVFVGYQGAPREGAPKWQNSRVFWNRTLSAEYQTFEGSHVINPEAQGTRLWVCIYRSNSQGTLWIDQVRLNLTALSPAQQVSLNRQEREWRYLQQRAEQAQKLLGPRPELEAIISQAIDRQDRCFQAEENRIEQRKEWARQRKTLSAQVNRLIHPDTDLVVSFAEPYARLEPTDLPPVHPSRSEEILALPGEYSAAAWTLTNGTDRLVSCWISMAGLDPSEWGVELRRQVFMETWYHREKKRLADPLPRLPQRGDTWRVEVPAGDTVKLHLGLHVPAPARGTVRASIRIHTLQGPPQELSLALRVLSALPPEASPFEHLAFVYPGSSVGGHSPELTARDLAAHGATLMEFPYMPPAEFTAEGELVTVDFSRHDRWLAAYGPHIRRLMIFWFGPLRTVEEEELEWLSEPWQRAFVNLLGAWLERAAEQGYGPSRFVLMPSDEPHSADLPSSPDEHVLRLAETLKMLRPALPELPFIATLSWYTYPEDLRALLPYLDITVPSWPYPTQLGVQYAPPDYNPRQAFLQTMLPWLKQRREETGLQILSYHVAGGKSDDLLTYNYAYPILALGADVTGVSHWAYNVIRGSSWDDTDGGLLDYSFVYDGTEDHPLNHRVNPSGEVVVPSIRWEALRAGIQDARLLLDLRDASRKGEIPPSTRAPVEALWSEVESMYQDQSRLTTEWVSELSRRVRTLYARERGN